MTLTRNIILAVLAVVLGSFAVYSLSLHAFGSEAVNVPGSTNKFVYYNFFATTSPQTTFATSTTATSTNITAFFDTNGVRDDGSFNIAGAKKVTVYFSRDAGTGPNVGTTTFKIQATADGSTWTDFNQLVQATSTTVTSAVQSTASIVAATTTLIYGLDLDYMGFKAIRCIVVEAADGFHYCAASAQF